MSEADTVAWAARPARATMDQTLAETQLGPVRGNRLESGVTAWVRVPYALPPIGELRFRAPRPPIPWRGAEPARLAVAYPTLRFDDGVLCTEAVAMAEHGCAQIASPITTLNTDYLTGERVLGSEDCLHLNVWRPPGVDGPLPVVVDVFGGGMLAGHAADGAAFVAQHPVVFVSLNHRTGVLGFLYDRQRRPSRELLERALAGQALTEPERLALEDGSGNYGLLDLIQALRFVQDNIANFGGDPERITLTGRGSGGFLVNCLRVSPLARRVLRFAQLANHSGPTDLNVQSSRASARHTPALVRALANGSDLESLRTLPCAQLIRRQQQAKRLPPPRATADGWVMPADLRGSELRPIPFSRLLSSAATSVQVPTLVGATRDEANILYPFIAGRPWPAMARWLRAFDPDQPTPTPADARTARWFLSVRALLFTWLFARVLSRASWSMLVEMPLKWCSRVPKRAPTFVYEFAWNRAPRPFHRLFGAAHGLSERFLLGEFRDDDYFRPLFTRVNAPGRLALATVFQRYLVNFAHTGDPNHGPYAELTAWPANLDRRSDRMLLDATDEEAQPRFVARRGRPMGKTPEHAGPGRALSPIERLHACVGHSGATAERPRIVSLVVEGVAPDGFDEQAWLRAVAVAAEANPGARLRLEGALAAARWVDTHSPPRLRMVRGCAWDGMSSSGADFLDAVPLPLGTGPSCEVVLVEGPRAYLVARASHAVMDGGGLRHFLLDVLRARRGERPEGTNFWASDTDMMQSVRSARADWRAQAWAKPTGAPRGADLGDVWVRLRIERAAPQLLYRVARALAAEARRHSALPVRFGVPVDLRRHREGVRTTANMTGMVFLDIAADDTDGTLARQLRHQLANCADAYYHPVVGVVRLLPLGLLERAFARTAKNLLVRNAKMETGVISNLGRVEGAALSAADFRAERFFGVPIRDNFFCVLAGTDGHLDITLGMPKAYGSEGRLQALAENLRGALSAGGAPAPNP